jgi:CheY-like chemotaxis protein
VELHGGTVSAESAGGGQGATFRLRLPAMGAAEAVTTSDKRLGPSEPSARRSTLAAPLGATLDGVTVLVVDDEPDSRSLIQRLLEDRHAAVLEAGSAAEAIGHLATQVPDAIVSDIGMPGEDGYAMIKRIRAMTGAIAQVPAIALTAYARKEDRLRALSAGYQVHLAKPVEPGELVAMLQSIVRRPAQAQSAGSTGGERGR